MMGNMKRFVWKAIGVFLLVAGLIAVFIPPMLYFYYRRYVYTSVDVVPKEAAVVVVLGAAVSGTDTPSNALQDRLDVATSLYKQDKVSSIIVTGTRDDDNYYDEPKAMKAALVKAGVSEDIIVEDPEGFRTFASCRRLKDTFNVSKVIVVSQGYHLPRALFLCRSLGIEATGVYAVGSFSTYYSRWYTVREIMAMYVAVWDIATLK
jgi:vancomycin permeability regulator SanA